uniref:Uncharacterized protein n=1 Tax=Zea mays TaxID=4577 RepID=C4J2Q0_MAIZE|nr:unknown [Zea mays]
MDEEVRTYGLFAAACCGCNPAAAAASTVFFSLWIAAAAVQTAATVSACSLPNTPLFQILTATLPNPRVKAASFNCRYTKPPPFVSDHLHTEQHFFSSHGKFRNRTRTDTLHSISNLALVTYKTRKALQLLTSSRPGQASTSRSNDVHDGSYRREAGAGRWRPAAEAAGGQAFAARAVRGGPQGCGGLPDRPAARARGPRGARTGQARRARAGLPGLALRGRAGPRRRLLRLQLAQPRRAAQPLDAALRRAPAAARRGRGPAGAGASPAAAVLPVQRVRAPVPREPDERDGRGGPAVPGVPAADDHGDAAAARGRARQAAGACAGAGGRGAGRRRVREGGGDVPGDGRPHRGAHVHHLRHHAAQEVRRQGLLRVGGDDR